MNHVMNKSPLAIIVLIINVLGLGTMLVGLITMGLHGYEEIIYFGSAGILGAIQLFGAFLLLFGIRTMKSNTRKNLGFYWFLAVSDILFTIATGSIDEKYLEIGIGIGLVLSLYHLYINIGALNKEPLEINK